MQIKLSLRPEKQLILPYNYFYQLQSSVYAMLGQVYESDFWHDGGFGDLKNYKGFCFSGLSGKHKNDKENQKLLYDGPVYFEIRSAVFEFVDAFQRALEFHPFLKLFDTRLDVSDAALSNRHLQNGITHLQAVTPIVVHKTLSDRQHTHFFTPDENEFYIRICNNIKEKYYAVTGRESEEVLIRPAGEMKKTVTRYKDFLITGFTGPIDIKTDFKTAEFIYNTGLGEKNAEGFGFVEIR